MTTKQEKQEALESLRQLLPPGTEVLTALEHVSRSGMLRHISCYVAVLEDGQPAIRNITWAVGRALDLRRSDRGGLKMAGCGMDMGFALVYDLSSRLYPDSFSCIGDGAGDHARRCPSNDHSNGDRNYAPHRHSDGGYALRQRWL